MSQITVNDESDAILTKGLEKWEGYKTKGDVADYLIEYAMRRLAALERWQKRSEKGEAGKKVARTKSAKKRASKPKAAKNAAPKKKGIFRRASDAVGKVARRVEQLSKHASSTPPPMPSDPSLPTKVEGR